MLDWATIESICSKKKLKTQSNSKAKCQEGEKHFQRFSALSLEIPSVNHFISEKGILQWLEYQSWLLPYFKTDTVPEWVSHLLTSLGSKIINLDQFDFSIWINCYHIISFWRLNPFLGMCLTVQLFFNEEVASLLQVQATVITHETLWVVQLVPGFYYCASVKSPNE